MPSGQSHRDPEIAASSAARPALFEARRTAPPDLRDGGDRASTARRRPVTRSTAAITSRTEWGWPVPRLYAPDWPVATSDLERLDVSLRQIRHMDVVSQAGAVRRRIVVAEHLEPGAADRGLNGARNEMNLRRVILPDFAVRIGARRVEVAQRDRPQSVGALEMDERALDHELGFAVAVDRLLRVGLGDRRLDRLAVGRTRGREDEGADALGDHGLEHAQRADHVVAIVDGRAADGFADVQKRREVHDGVDAVARQRGANGRRRR